MKPFNRWIALILILPGILFSACTKAPKPAEKIKPAQLEEIAGSDFKRVILTEKAADRIGITTVLISEMPAMRKLTVGGEIVVPKPTRAISAKTPKVIALIRVHLNETDFDKVDKEALALILPLTQNAGFTSLNAKSIELDEGDDDIEDGDEEGWYYFEIEDEVSNLDIGQRVFVELPRRNRSEQQKVVPYAAVIYGVNGETWVYTNPEPLVFIRQPIVIDYIEGDQAFLSEGPDTGTVIVTVGVAELFGAETGVSK
jgi:hypothetical protein